MKQSWAPVSKISTICLLIGMLGACTDSPDRVIPKPGSQTQVFTFGDPLNVAKSTKSNKKLNLTDRDIKRGGWRGSYVTRFHQESEVSGESQNPLAQSASVEDIGSFADAEYNFRESDDRLFLESATEGSVSFQFQRVEGEWRLQEVSGRLAELIHLSRRDDSGLISLLVRVQLSNGTNTLIAFYFTEPAPINYQRKPLPELSVELKSQFAFLNPDRPLRWRGDRRTLSLCGKFDDLTKRAFLSAVEQWNLALKDRFTIVAEIQTEGPPFSDVNYSCVYQVPDYYMIQSQWHTNPGVTLTSSILTEGEITDADVFLWQAEIDKSRFSTPEDRFRFVRAVLLHEIGHFLGLDHPSSQNAKTIMSYGASTELEEYDLSAIKALYVPQ